MGAQDDYRARAEALLRQQPVQVTVIEGATRWTCLNIYKYSYRIYGVGMWIITLLGCLHGLGMKGPVWYYHQLYDEDTINGIGHFAPYAGPYFWYHHLLVVLLLLFFGYFEGYLGFQQSFSPRLVRRAWDYTNRHTTCRRERSHQSRELIFGAEHSIIERMNNDPNSERYHVTSYHALRSFIGCYLPCFAANNSANNALDRHNAIERTGSDESLIDYSRVPNNFFFATIDFACAPLLVAGLIHATTKRLVIVWGVVIGVTILVILIVYMPSPWRNIVDIGVVFGLLWGAVSMIAWSIAIALGRGCCKSCNCCKIFDRYGRTPMGHEVLYFVESDFPYGSLYRDDRRSFLEHVVDFGGAYQRSSSGERLHEKSAGDYDYGGQI